MYSAIARASKALSNLHNFHRSRIQSSFSAEAKRRPAPMVRDMEIASTWRDCQRLMVLLGTGRGCGGRGWRNICAPSVAIVHQQRITTTRDHVEWASPGFSMYIYVLWKYVNRKEIHFTARYIGSSNSNLYIWWERARFFLYAQLATSHIMMWAVFAAKIGIRQRHVHSPHPHPRAQSNVSLMLYIYIYIFRAGGKSNPRKMSAKRHNGVCVCTF